MIFAPIMPNIAHFLAQYYVESYRKRPAFEKLSGYFSQLELLSTVKHPILTNLKSSSQIKNFFPFFCN